jgi:hypothetical protein
VLLWSAVAAKDSCSLRGPLRGERRSMTSMTVARGVSSQNRGRNSDDGSNSNGRSGAPVAPRGHKDEGERGGVLALSVKERMGALKRVRW